jgi:septal ring factor EnvC (AmiA/AmiB activator)
MPEVLNLATTVPKAIAKLEALRPRMEEMENVDANLTKAKAELAEAKAETNSLAADRDKIRSDLAQSKSELVTVLGGLNAGYKELERLERELKKAKR